MLPVQREEGRLLVELGWSNCAHSVPMGKIRFEMLATASSFCCRAKSYWLVTSFRLSIAHNRVDTPVTPISTPQMPSLKLARPARKTSKGSSFIGGSTSAAHDSRLANVVHRKMAALLVRRPAWRIPPQETDRLTLLACTTL